MTYFLTAFPILLLSWKFGISETSSLFQDQFLKDKQNYSLNMTVFNKFSYE